MQPATNPSLPELDQPNYRPLVLAVAILILLQTLFATGISFVFYIFSFGNIILILISFAILVATIIAAIASIRLIRKRASSPQAAFFGFCNLSFTFLISVSLSNIQGTIILLSIAIVIYAISAVALLIISRHSLKYSQETPLEAAQPQIAQWPDNSVEIVSPVRSPQPASVNTRKNKFVFISRSTATLLICMPLILPLGTIFLIAIINSFLPISRELGVQLMQATISISIFTGMVSLTLGVWMRLSIHRREQKINSPDR